VRHDDVIERWARNDAVLWRRSGAAIVLKLPKDTEIVALEHSGHALWEALAEPATLRQLVLRLGDGYDVAAEVIEQDLRAVLEDLERRDFVRRVAA
jgi:hypothetical protein